MTNLLISLLLAASTAGTELPFADRLLDVHGELQQAQLERIDDAWNLTFQTAEQEQPRYAAQQVAIFGRHREPAQGPLVMLANGGTLAADVLEITSDHVVVESSLWRTARLPREQIRAVIFRLPLAANQRDRMLDTLQTHEDRRDMLWLEDDETIEGILTRPADTDADAIWRLHEQNEVRLRHANREIDVAMDRVVAMAFGSHRDRTSDEAVAWVGFRDGSLLRVAGFERQEEEVEVRLGRGAVLRSDARPLALIEGDPASFWHQITLLQPDSNAVTYLSDEPSIGYRHVPWLDVSWPYQRDRSVRGLHLRAGGYVYTKGLGMTSTSRLAYRIPSGAARFFAELAMDQAAGRGGSVVYRVYLNQPDDGWQVAYSSPVIRGGQPPIPLSLDLGQARAIALIVEFAERGDERDDANWLNACFLKPEP